MAKPTYESLVKQWRQAAKSQWVLGDLSSKVETVYGEGKLQEYADDIGVTYSALREYRRVAAAWENAKRLADVPWTVHAVLAAQDDRHALIQPDLTYRAAQAIVRGRKEATPGVPPIEEDTWLRKAYGKLRPMIVQRTGIEVPDARVSIGWPLNKTTSGTDTLGAVWHGAPDGIPQIYVSPQVADPDRVLDILTHEMLHAGLPKVGHKKPFADAAKQMGLDGPAKETFAGPHLKVVLQDLAEELGEYPHAPLKPPGSKTRTAPKDAEPNTRTVKYACIDCQGMQGDGEGYSFIAKITVSRTWLMHGWPDATYICPIDGKVMEIIDE